MNFDFNLINFTWIDSEAFTRFAVLNLLPIYVQILTTMVPPKKKKILTTMTPLKGFIYR